MNLPARKNPFFLLFLSLGFLTLLRQFERGQFSFFLERKISNDRPFPDVSFSELRTELLGVPLSGCGNAISAELNGFFQSYVRHHAKQLQDFRSGGFEDSRVLFYLCKRTDSGGLGDRLKGFLGALLLAFASPEGRALFMSCDGTLPLTRAWLPSSKGFDWFVYDGFVPDTSFHVHALDNPDNLRAIILELQRNRHHRGIQYFSNMISPVCFNASIWGDKMSAWSINHLKKGSPSCNLPPEIYGLSGAIASPLCLLSGFNFSHGNSTLYPACGLASDLNFIFRLLDFIIAPTTALVRRVREIASDSYQKKENRYVISIHIRTGSGDSNMSFIDPPRDEPLRAARLAAHCADLVNSELSNTFGVRQSVLWFIASDSIKASKELRRIAEKKRDSGENITFASSSENFVVHIDKTIASAYDVNTIERGFLDVFAEHFLLSAAHGMVRSRSGFSESSQAWGRIPIVKKIKLGLVSEEDACIDENSFSWK